MAGHYPDVSPAPSQIRPIPKPPLREGLAGATRTRDTPRGVRFEVHGPSVGRGKWGARLAELTDTEQAPRWRHPVFGDTENWRTQVGKPWFFVTIRAGEPVFRAGVERAMEKTARRIMRNS